MKKNALYVTQAAMIAAIYVVLTYLMNALGLANGAIQLRLSEALCILPVFTPAAIPGLFVGCLLSNTLTGCAIWDIVFGSLATLIGAAGTYLLRETKFLCTLPPVLANVLILPWVLRYCYGLEDGVLYLMVTIGIGEVLSVCVLGLLVRRALWNHRSAIFRTEATEN